MPFNAGFDPSVFTNPSQAVDPRLGKRGLRLGGAAPTQDDARTGSAGIGETLLEQLPIILGMAATGGVGLSGLGSGAAAAGDVGMGADAASGAGMAGAGAAAPTAAGAGVGSGVGAGTGLGTYGTILKTAQTLAPILGGAAKSQADAGRLQDKTALDYANENALLPAERLRAATHAGFVNTATPFSLKFNGPGSGMKGNAFTASGGIDPSKLPQSVRDLSNSVMQDELSQQLNGPLTPHAGTGVGNNVLGGAATGAGILGALLPLLTKNKRSGAAPVPGTDASDPYSPNFDWQTYGIG